ncbi:hypothetical protein MUK42_21923 [Musa troglodytarum]|uniref:Uncharacterized protein n=1 Tax=Musa troglodytarum TaxID=320322 RepID=A0A9E7K6L2_9LILI|nr:hypothetical protein MUK42_21923 [Musa troglodytarum]
MEKDGQISVRKRPTKRRRSRGFVKAVADYLASDCYMYAPILDVPPPDLPLSSAARSPPTTEIRTHRSISCHTEMVSAPSVY